MPDLIEQIERVLQVGGAFSRWTPSAVCQHLEKPDGWDDQRFANAVGVIMAEYSVPGPDQKFERISAGRYRIRPVGPPRDRSDEAVRRVQRLGMARITAAAAALSEAAASTPPDAPTRKPRNLICLPRKGRLLRIVRLLLAGFSNKEIARRTTAHKGTIARARKVQEDFLGAPIPCLCGRPATHQGWCAARYLRSPKRQEFIQAWHRARRTPTGTKWTAGVTASAQSSSEPEP